jgi:hypothetical protein
MNGIAEWPASRGMEEYAQRFAENAIDLSVVRDEIVRREYDKLPRGSGLVRGTQMP